MSQIVIVVLILLLLVILYYHTKPIEKAEDKAEEVKKLQDEGDISVLASLPKEELDFLLKYGSSEDLVWASRPIKFQSMTQAEKLQYIIDNYFPKKKTADESKVDKKRVEISEITRSDEGCEDNYPECADWAAGGECKINPEYMLYNCPKSCHVCKSSIADKAKLIKAYNSLPLDQCVYHGENYPGEGYFLHTFYDYISY
jgi:hypothetical protein